MPVGPSRRRLIAAAPGLLAAPAQGRFGPAEVAGLPEPVRRYLTAAIPEGAPLATATVLGMRGRIRLGRWVPFTARQWLAPHTGFLWAARAAGVVSGHDRYLGGVGEMHFRLLGLATVMRATGPDVDRSAAGRGAAEGVWLPTALLPRFGVSWSADDETHIRARWHLDAVPVDLRLVIDPAGHVRAFTFDRWGDPDETGTYDWRPFGGDVTATARVGPCLVPAGGRVGWHHGTDRWPEGEFFRYRLTQGRPFV